MCSVSVIVCYYNNNQSSDIKFMTLFAMSFLQKNNSGLFEITVVDGSKIKDELFEKELIKLQVNYLHSGRDLSFGETYNYGINYSDSPIIVTLANDIFIEAKQIIELADEARNNVGCVIPYLSYSDYSVQNTRKYLVPKRSFPSRMTFNVNVFQRKALEEIGYIDEEMSGCFNDVLAFIKLRENGYSIVLKNVGNIFHLSQQTLKSNFTTVSYQNDQIIFQKKYPNYWSRGHILFYKTTQRFTTKIIYWVIEHISIKLVKKSNIWKLIWLIEPYICAEKSTYTKGLKKIFAR